MMRNIASPPSSLTTSRSQECSEVFNRLQETLQAEGAQIAKQISGVLQWHINKDVWTMSVLNGKGIVIEGTDARLTPDLHIHMDEHDFLDLTSGKLRLQQVRSWQYSTVPYHGHHPALSGFVAEPWTGLNLMYPALGIGAQESQASRQHEASDAPSTIRGPVPTPSSALVMVQDCAKIHAVQSLQSRAIIPPPLLYWRRKCRFSGSVVMSSIHAIDQFTAATLRIEYRNTSDNDNDITILGGHTKRTKYILHFTLYNCRTALLYFTVHCTFVKTAKTISFCSKQLNHVVRFCHGRRVSLRKNERKAD